MDPTGLPSLADLPISPDAKPGIGWTPSMLEMAEHIGPYATLLVSQHFGGQELYIPTTPEKNPFREVVGPEKAKAISWVYGTQRIIIPLARNAIHRARRAPVIAAVRAGELKVVEAAHILGMRRDTVSRIVNSHDEGQDVPALRLGRRKVDPRQIDMFGDN